jgi:N-acetylmuramoyl-L-alanine amidase
VIALVVGHDESSRGAQLLDTGVREWGWCRELAASLQEQLQPRRLEPMVFLRDPAIRTYRGQLAELCGRVNGHPARVVLSLHFNAAPSSHRGLWSGATALHWPSSTSGRRAAEVLSAAAAEAIGNRNRGAKPQAESWAGSPLYILRDTRAPAVILEPFFGDHVEDATAATRARDSGRLALFLADAIEEWL